jgi:formiminoglutamase
MTLPIAISVPHAGVLVPREAAPYCQLTRQQIIKDGDEFASEIYDLRNEVAEFITTDVARAIIDLNRAPDDRGADGVVKRHTIYNEAIYREPLPESAINTLLDNYYYPYHARLSDLSTGDLLFAIDCHTMAAVAPPIGPHFGTKRPEICLGNLHGRSFPEAWTTILLRTFRDVFPDVDVAVNEPFAGGYITRTHCVEIPWLQLEVSRSQFLPSDELRRRCILVLRRASERIHK